MVECLTDSGSARGPDWKQPENAKTKWAQWEIDRRAPATGRFAEAYLKSYIIGAWVCHLAESRHKGVSACHQHPHQDR
ncbi:hypothetical protein GCM10009786_01350 [Leucobacter alluvii]|uniref:Uncharacterized protein n=1 Tax=Leucobacter alluvii TaxID=340321 RepID=A0ABP5MWU7_9MICO